ncbi:MAG: tyrosine-type recombinase/integrase [Phycisphaerae bacterium]|nr:tyrosine-type recombinase/integrase [Phycisphaerae bacterium]
MEQITTAQISEFVAALVRARGLAPKTANRHREILTRLFNWAMEQRGIRLPGDRNPAAAVERYKEPAPKIRFLTLKQIDEQLDALAPYPQLQAMVALYIYAGLRREEALWLQVEDIDYTTGPFGMIRIRAKEVGGSFWQPKTKVNRAVPISSALRAYLDCYEVPASDAGWFFPSPQGKHYDPDNFSSDLRRAQLKLGLIWACLDYRHTFGSQLAMKGESLYKISTLMGNSPEICRRHYASLVPEMLAVAVEFLRFSSYSTVDSIPGGAAPYQSLDT